MEAIINHEMLVLAREARGLSQLQMAEAIGMSATNFSKIERADIGISEQKLERLAEAVGCPVQFFFRQGQVVPENMLYRKRQVVSQKLITAIHAQANVIRLQVQELIRLLQLPSYDATKMILPLQNSAAAMAKWFRRQCNIQEPIIANLTQLLESNDIVTSNFDFGTPRVDSRSIFLEAKRPMIITNSTLTGCRQRFSLAYELGLLLIMNGGLAVSNKEASHQANLFAAELLMPEEEIRTDFEQGITVDLLAQLKPKWKVSMIALLYRADDLGYLTPNQKRYLLQQFNALNIRRREPLELDIVTEQPQLIKHWVAQVKSKLKLSTVELAALLCMELTEFMERYN